MPFKDIYVICLQFQIFSSWLSELSIFQLFYGLKIYRRFFLGDFKLCSNIENYKQNYCF